MQLGMLLEDVRGEAGENIEQVVTEFHEEVDLGHLREAWQVMVRTHPALRTSFHWQDGVGHQRVHPPPGVEIKTTKLEQDSDEALRTWLDGERLIPFRLDTPHPTRFTLIKLGDKNYRFVWTYHHIILDGRSAVTIVKQAIEAYQALLEGKPYETEGHLPLQQHVEALKALPPGHEHPFWAELFEGIETTTALPLDRGPRALPFRGHREHVLPLKAVPVGDLDAFAKKHGVTPNTILQAAWAMLVGRYTGTDSVLFGCTRACRHAVAGAETIIGNVMNTLPFRADVPRERTVLDLLQGLRQRWVDMRAVEHTTLPALLETTSLFDGQPPFVSHVVFEGFDHSTTLQMLGPTWAKRPSYFFEQSSLPLSLSATVGKYLLLKLEYDRSRFSDDDAATLTRHLARLIEGMVRRPDATIGDLDVLDDDDRKEIFALSVAPKVPFPTDQTIDAMIGAQVRKTPSAIAVRDGDETLSYADFWDRAGTIAAELHRRGVAPGDRVGICLGRSLDLATTLVGTLRAGAAYVPLDPAYPRERLAFMAKDADLRITVASRQTEEALRGAGIESWVPGKGMEAKEAPDVPMDPERIAYVIYTSGSTGQPKGVPIRHRSVINHATAIIALYGLGPTDRM
ncbi:MAG: AMP-binding protein, partial [Myxococcales bacterium]|nr:AMP-binding protein [Myxococcales bacterium]